MRTATNTATAAETATRGGEGEESSDTVERLVALTWTHLECRLVRDPGRRSPRDPDRRAVVAAGCCYCCASKRHSRNDSRNECIDAVRRPQLKPRCFDPDLAQEPRSLFGPDPRPLFSQGAEPAGQPAECRVGEHLDWVLARTPQRVEQAHPDSHPCVDRLPRGRSPWHLEPVQPE